MTSPNLPVSVAACWVQFGDLHAEAADDWQSVAVFRELVDEANRYLAPGVDFALLPGDNANHGTLQQYQQIAQVTASLQVGLHVLPGDHDFEPGSLVNFYQGLASRPLPYAVTYGGLKCLFLDIVSAGSGGPDFRLGERDFRWLRRELAQAELIDQPSMVCMHAYPGDLRVDGDRIAQLFADSGVRWVATGHTHYNEVLNDGRVLYSSTRSTGQIEEGLPGFSVGAVDGAAKSWRFKAIDDPWPFVLITAPPDLRLVTDPSDREQVPVDSIRIRAKAFGPMVAQVVAVLDDERRCELVSAGRCAWQGDFLAVAPGLHRLTVVAQGQDGNRGSDSIEVLVRPPDDRPKRQQPHCLGTDIHSVGAWPEHGLLGTCLGPNKNGRRW